MVTHTGKLFSIKSVSFEWVSPVQFEGQILFRATVVQDYSTFWKDVESLPVNVSNPYNVSVDQQMDELPRQQRHSQDFVATSKIGIAATSKTGVENSTVVALTWKKKHNDYNDASSGCKALSQSLLVYFVFFGFLTC